MIDSGHFLRGLGLRASLRRTVQEPLRTAVQRMLTGPLRMRRHGRCAMRRLEIGPVPQRIEGFETLNVVGAPQVDDVVDATRTLPFPDGSFDPISASHVLEHVPWYQTVRTLRLWRDKLKPGGRLEVWVPDALKIADLRRRRAARQRCAGPGRLVALQRRARSLRVVRGRISPAATDRARRATSTGTLRPPRSGGSRRRCARPGGARSRAWSAGEVRGYDHGWIDLGVKGLR